MTTIDEILKAMTPEVHAGLRRAVEIGKWPDGRVLSDEQRALCMEAVIAYDARFLPEEQRVGYIDRGSKAEGERCGDTDASTILKWADRL